MFWDFELNADLVVIQMFDKYFFAWSNPEVAITSLSDGWYLTASFESRAPFQNPDELTYTGKLVFHES
jgi:hypothetical protein